jgi:hypothetical protein
MLTLIDLGKNGDKCGIASWDKLPQNTKTPAEGSLFMLLANRSLLTTYYSAMMLDGK